MTNLGHSFGLKVGQLKDVKELTVTNITFNFNFRYILPFNFARLFAFFE